MTEKKVYTLLSVTQAVEKVINTWCSRAIWIKAEIVRLNYYSQSGHAYPDLVEKRDGKIVAEMRGNIWSSNLENIRSKFRATLNEELGDNMTIVCLATVKYSSLHGISLNITDIDPGFTLGELAKQRAETIKKLTEEKIFGLNKEKKLPSLPKNIAIISVDTSKGYSDFMNVLSNNSWGYRFHTLLFPAVLQGEKAVSTIIAKLEIIKKYSDVFDTVALIRGGGGEVGLSSYDDYPLAREIALFPIPVLTGIGHSTNETVAGLVSYRNFITPTKVAEFLIQQYHNFLVPVEVCVERLNYLSESMLDKQTSNIRETARLFSSITYRLFDKQKFSVLQTVEFVKNYSSALLTGARHNIRNNAGALRMSTARYIQARDQELLRTVNSLHNGREKLTAFERNALNDFRKSLLINCKNMVDMANRQIKYTGEKITLLSPEKTLKRGFSITRINSLVLNKTAQAKKGDILETEISDGRIISTVIEKK